MAEIDSFFAKIFSDLFDQHVPRLDRDVHLVHEHEDRDALFSQHPVKRLGMGPDPLRRAYYEKRIVEHGKSALRLSRKIDVSRSVDQRHVSCFPDPEVRLLREYRDAALPLDRSVIEEGVPVVHPSGLFQLSGQIEDRFRQRRLARVNVGRYSYRYPFSNIAHIPYCSNDIVPNASVTWKFGCAVLTLFHEI